MIRSWTEAESRINSLYLGEPIFIVDTDAQSLDIKPASRLNLDDQLTNDWADQLIKHNIKRYIDKDTLEWRVSPDAIKSIAGAIHIEIIRIISKCLDAKDVKRTSLYKDYCYYKATHLDNAGYLNDIIPIINYYHTAPTDSTCKNNTIGLLQILRKKYGTPDRK
jgi:hypothetical protein